MKRSGIALILTIILAASTGCFKVVQLPPTPSIEFTSFEIFDTLDILGNISKGGRLIFRFEDGDGDLGLGAPVGTQQDTTNFHLELYRKKDGSMVKVSDKYDPLLPYSSYRIPYMERLGQNQILKGTISVTFIYQTYNTGDTIKYEFYIQDRADNISNTEETVEIIVAENNIYTR
ncbi:MAG TPA: hypothetical protein VMV47_12920 [Bacteroidales bacterium]|nr:hypothetical protein [Bacteroidales bacterium]